MRPLLVLVLLLGSGSALAETPSIAPRRIAFTAEEYSAYEDAHRARTNKLIIVFGGGTIGALLATGITLLAIGLSPSGNTALTTTGMGSLSLATLGGFTALELYQW
ncbi:MAG: hypothetical protein JRH20_15350 [Deltaproteobacteria bacterium]|nr:hypothetical protein [Deltaproteobacteria bacterium]